MQCFMYVFINKRPCAIPDSNKALVNILGYLIFSVFAITPHTEHTYISLDTMCTLEFPHFNPSEATVIRYQAGLLKSFGSKPYLKYNIYKRKEKVGLSMCHCVIRLSSLWQEK